MNFLFTCGGTAGHINPAIAVADSIREKMPDAKILFIGSGRELENRLIPKAGYELKNITASGFQRSFSPPDIMQNIIAVKNVFIGMRQAGKILREFKPDVAIGTGGYVCYPVLKKAAALKIPTAIHESNAIPGLTTKLVSSSVDKIMVSFDGMQDKYKDPKKVVVTGMPVRGAFELSKKQARLRLGLDDRPLVVSFWGSLGAAKMNEIMTEFIKCNSRVNIFNHIHATGGDRDNVDFLIYKLIKLGVNIRCVKGLDIRPYIDDMGTVMAAADIVLCRSGASTIGELTFLGKPAILVPSPNVTNNHQEKNARMMEAASAAKVILEPDCTGENIFSEVTSILNDKKLLEDMTTQSKALGFVNAADKIADLLVELCD